MLQEEEEKEDVKEIKLEHNLTKLSTTDRLIDAVRKARCGSIRPRKDVTFSMQ